MNKNGTNPGMNVEDYEDMAVQKSNAAKRILVGRWSRIRRNPVYGAIRR